MFYFKIVSLILLSSAVSAYEFDKIDGIDGEVLQMGIDSESNIYVYVRVGVRNIYGDVNYHTTKLYKLNPEKQIIFEDQIDDLRQILITKLNYAFIFTAKDYGKTDLLIHVFKPGNSSEMIKIAEFNTQSFFWAGIPLISFADLKGNVIFNAPNGVAIFKKGKTVPVSVANLENFYAEHYVIDSSNDIYLTGVQYETEELEKGLSLGAVITSDELEKPVPSAKTFGIIQSGLGDRLSQINKYGNQLIFVFNGPDSRISTLEKDFSGEFKVLHHQPSFQYNDVLVANNYFYFLGQMEDTCSLSFFAFNSSLKNSSQIEQVSSDHLQDFCRSGILYDKERENIYFVTIYRVYRLKVGETQLDHVFNISREIDPDNRVLYISPINNFGDVLLLTEKNLYEIQKNDTKLNRLIKCPIVFGIRGMLTNNEETNDEIYIGSEKGLYVLKK